MIYTVSQLNTLVKTTLTTFPPLQVVGEVSNFTRASSGHWYFSLKDSQAQLRCVMFKQANKALDFEPKHGMQLLAQGHLTLYAERGTFQLIASHLKISGEGELQKRFQALKKKLTQAGLFDPASKQAIPKIPQHIGLITSPTGAALRDVLNVLKRRFPITPITIYPSLVQGEKASKQVIKNIRIANKQGCCDVLLMARGGGSLEDLWPFNEEALAYAIYESQVPIVTGIGHQTDFTIADFVADLRAETPSAAAEHISPNQTQIMTQLHVYEKKIKHELTQQLTQKTKQLAYLEHRFKQASEHHFKQTRTTLTYLHKKLVDITDHHLQTKKHVLHDLISRLKLLNPEKTMERGYAMIFDSHGKLIQSIKALAPGNKIHIQLSFGKVQAIISDITPKSESL